MARKWTFLAVSLCAFVLTFGVLALGDALPNPIVTPVQQAQTPTGPVAPAAAVVTGELPTKIAIPSINLAVTVENPQTADTKVLDERLLYGAVRYPSSGLLGTPGANVVIFGHSSYLPVVHNQAYKAFDGIQTLKTGDQILVTGSGRVFVYSVETVASANAQKDGIPLTVTGNKLTLVTCDSFASKSDRFVVIANLVESYPVAN